MSETTSTSAPAVTGVKYEKLGTAYLEERRLKKSAGTFHLWALGVGAVISGMFGGWNLGLASGGFGGLLIATILMTIMYVCMVYSIAELSAALPHAGGFYSFARNAFGPWGGMIVGISDTIEYVLTPAVIVFFIGGYMQALFPDIHPAVWWVSFYAVFLSINIKGVELTFKVGLIITMLAILVLLIYFASVLGKGAFDSKLLLISPEEGQPASWFPKGYAGIFASLPFAIWFYLAIEQLPLAAEETHDVVESMPKALIYGIATLIVLAFLTLFLNSGVGAGAAAMGASAAPLSDGFKAVFGESITTALFTIIAVIGLVASFHTTLYAAGRVVFALSRSGYYPRWMSLCTKSGNTPHLALITSTVLGLLVALVCSLDPKTVGPALLSMAVFGAVISYSAVMICYIKLKLSKPDLARPYKSPLGIPGAAIGTALALTALLSTLAEPTLRPAVIGTAIFFVLMIAYFAFYSSKKLVADSPEEQAALSAEISPELPAESDPELPAEPAA